jgi:hypothetical protein
MEVMWMEAAMASFDILFRISSEHESEAKLLSWIVYFKSRQSRILR